MLRFVSGLESSWNYHLLCFIVSSNLQWDVVSRDLKWLERFPQKVVKSHHSVYQIAALPGCDRIYGAL